MARKTFNTTMDRFMSKTIPKRKTGKENASNQFTEKALTRRARHGWIDKYATQYVGIATKS